jgi:hypothetical protein
VVRELMDLLRMYIENGCSTPGPRQEYDSPDYWLRLSRMAD